MAKAKKSKPKVILVTLVKSPIGYSERQKKTVKALGLRRMNQTVEHVETPSLLGMLDKVSHLIEVQEVSS